MLLGAPIMITFSADDLDKAKKFYRETLGLEVGDSVPGMLELKFGQGTNVMIYAKKDHKPADYTLLNFTVQDLARTMADMEARGVTFKKYDLPDIKSDDKGVVDYGSMKIAFFDDPAGNNHAVLQMADQK